MRSKSSQYLETLNHYMRAVPPSEHHLGLEIPQFRVDVGHGLQCYLVYVFDKKQQGNEQRRCILLTNHQTILATFGPHNSALACPSAPMFCTTMPTQLRTGYHLMNRVHPASLRGFAVRKIANAKIKTACSTDPRRYCCLALLRRRLGTGGRGTLCRGTSVLCLG